MFTLRPSLLSLLIVKLFLKYSSKCTPIDQSLVVDPLICDEIIALRKDEADTFYGAHCAPALSHDELLIQRQAFAGLLWSKQFYHFVVQDWLLGDPEMPRPPAERMRGRNRDWRHMYCRDVISMPDKWEYPW